MKKAKIIWKKTKDGGKRKIPPIDIIFYPMIKINNYKESMNWSFFLINKEIISDYETIAEIDFLMDNAPRFLLKSNVEFTLHEGAMEIAKGKIE